MANTINESAIKKLKLLFTVVDRPKAEFYLDVLSQFEVNFQMVLSGLGTANSELIELLDLSDVSYDGLHDGIEVRIRGTLPQDREKMLSKLDQTIEAYRAKAPVYALTGKEQQACDPHRTQMTE
mgnify:CR=1 FL=1